MPAQAEPLQVTLAGALLRDAEMRLATGTRQPTVTVLIGQPGRPPVRAVELFPDGAAGQHAAYCKARLLRAGAHVRLCGEGLRPVKVPGTGEVVQVASVSELRLLDTAFDAARAAANDGDERE